MDVPGQIAVPADDVRLAERIQSSLNGGNVTGRGWKQCSSVQCSSPNLDRSFHFQAVYTMNLTLNDKAELFLANAPSHSSSVACDQFKRLDSEKKRPVSPYCEETENHVLADGDPFFAITFQQTSDR